jgi:hypothetical protein
MPDAPLPWRLLLGAAACALLSAAALGLALALGYCWFTSP